MSFLKGETYFTIKIPLYHTRTLVCKNRPIMYMYCKKVELCSIKDHLKCLSFGEKRLRDQLSLKSFLFGVKIQQYHFKCNSNYINKIIKREPICVVVIGIKS